MTLGELLDFVEMTECDRSAELELEVDFKSGDAMLQGRVDGLTCLKKGQSFRCVEAMERDTLVLSMTVCDEDLPKVDLAPCVALGVDGVRVSSSEPKETGVSE